MTNRNRFLFRREPNLASELVLLPQANFLPSIPPVTHTIDLLELKEPNVVGEPTPGKKIGIKAPPLYSSYELCLPVDDGNSGQFLTTDGTGILSWQTGGGGGNTVNAATGIFSGGILSINADDTKFNVSDGSGVIFDTTTLVATTVTWSGLIAQSGVYIADTSFVSINLSGVPILSSTTPTNSEIRDNIFLGQIVHLNQVNLNAVLNEQMTLLSTNNQLRDFMEAVGDLNTSGNLMSSNSLLTIAKSLGTLLSFGGNYAVDVNNPHFPSIPSLDTNLGGGPPNIFS